MSLYIFPHKTNSPLDFNAHLSLMSQLPSKLDKTRIILRGADRRVHWTSVPNNMLFLNWHNSVMQILFPNNIFALMIVISLFLLYHRLNIIITTFYTSFHHFGSPGKTETKSYQHNVTTYCRLGLLNNTCVLLVPKGPLRCPKCLCELQIDLLKPTVTTAHKYIPYYKWEK